MITILKEIFETAIKLGDYDFDKKAIEKKWLGQLPASKQDIKQAENKLKVSFPNDYKEFLLITNGYCSPNFVDPAFESVDKIDYLKNVDTSFIESRENLIPETVRKDLERSILVGGKETLVEDIFFVIIPPNLKDKRWKYWKWADWNPNEESYLNLEEYFDDMIAFMKKEIMNSNS